MKKYLNLISLLPIALSLSSCNSNKADLIVTGNIYTGSTYVECIAIKDGRYIYVGDKSGVDIYKNENTKLVEDVTFLMPSGTETHGHFIAEAAFKKGLYIPMDLYYKPHDIVEFVVQYKNNHPGLTKLYGYGWSQFIMPYISNPRELLDDPRIGDIPICIASDSLHALWCNTAFLKEAGVYDKECEVSQVLRDSNGIATGFILDEACFYLRNKVFGELLGENDFKEAVKDASKFLNSLGYTAHYDSWSNFDGTDAMFKAVSSVDKDGEATMYYTGSYDVPSYSNFAEEINKAKSLRNKYSTDHYSPNFIKLFADGVVEAKTGYVLEPYLNSNDSHGTQLFTDEKMKEIVNLANKNRFMVHTHTYGDAAVKETVDAYLDSFSKNGKYRNSVAHVCLVSDSDLDRMAKNGISVAAGSNWGGMSDDDTFEKEMIKILGEDRTKQMYPDNRFVEHNVIAGVSTDRPCANGFVENVFDYIGYLTTGIDYREGLGGSTSRRNQHLSVKEAIDMITINGAYLGNVENKRGSIEVGKYSDFIIATGNPFKVDLNKINEIDVQSTYFEGKLVYSKQ